MCQAGVSNRGKFGSLSPPEQWLPTRSRFRDVRAPLQPHQLYIGRGPRPYVSRWANPFKLSKMPRAESLASFEQWIRGEKELLQQLGELKGKELLCHCGPTAGCHGDILVKLFEEIVPCRAQPAAIHLVIGLPWSVEGFFAEARAKIHPCDRDPRWSTQCAWPFSPP